jgi:DNA-binding transcriptional regulator YiaG
MERIVGISEAAEVLGASVPTLRRWEAAGHQPNGLSSGIAA